MSSGKRHKVLERLGKSEPSTFEDVRAILESIRASKGYVEEQVRLEVNTLSPDIRDSILAVYTEKREGEAAITKMYAVQPHPMSHVVKF
jgi:hypothetical protein